MVRAMSAWISVDEARPQVGEHVVVLCSDEWVDVAVYPRWSFPIIRGAERRVRHWLALPAAPRSCGTCRHFGDGECTFVESACQFYADGVPFWGTAIRPTRVLSTDGADCDVWCAR